MHGAASTVRVLITRASWRMLVSVMFAAMTVMLAAAPVGADTLESGLVLTVDRVEAESDGRTSITVGVRGLGPDQSIDPDDIQIVENGDIVQDVTVGSSEVIGSAATEAAVVIAIDRSGSAIGPAIDTAKVAAAALARDLTDAGSPVAIVSFAGGVSTDAPLGAEPAAVEAAIESLTGGGGTALYDGVLRSTRILSTYNGPREIVLFSDGGDTTSTASLDDVRGLLSGSDTRVTVVSLVLEEPVPELAAITQVSGGSVTEVTGVDGLEEAFAAVAANLRNRITLSWTAEPVADRASTLSIVATYRDGEQAASDGVQVDNPRVALLTPPRAVDTPEPFIAALTGTSGLVLGVAAVALSVALIAFILLAASGDRRRDARLDERLAAFDTRPEDETTTGRASRGSSFSNRAADVFDVIPRPSTVDERLAARIEQADWPLRVGEFLLLVGAAAMGLTAVFAIAGAPWWLALTGIALGAIVPFGVLTSAIGRRQRAFADQLPDVLQVIGGALRAGHAFSTAVDGAVDEVDDPASSELRRASVEARLGRPMDQALVSVSERMGSVDLGWVVSALIVQREVGGNLAEVLNNVAGTLRARASVRRQVKALSAEGRLSANIIAATPFVMFVALTILSPDYIAILFQRSVGRFILLLGLVLLVAGIIWLRRLVRPQF